MHPRPSFRAAALLLALPLAFVPAVDAEPVRLVAADDRGVTLELALPSYTVGPPGEDGRSRLTAPGLAAGTPPGRPVLPAATTLVALPPGALPVLGRIEGDPEETRDGVRLIIGDRRGFAEDVHGLGMVPFAEPVEPIRDGPWPAVAAELGVPFALRGQRMVAVTLRPFRYDEGLGTLWARRRMRVRIDFGGAAAPVPGLTAAPEDRHWDPVLRNAVLNFEQGRAWRISPRDAAPGARPPDRRSGSLFDRVPGRDLAPAERAGVPLFDESEPEVRVRLDSTGVYSIAYDLLAAQGFPANVPVEEVSVHRHEFSEDAPPPVYTTIELPIEIDEAQPPNGRFDAGDRIVLFAQSWAERSGASLPQRGWGDAEVVYVTRVPRPALRIAARSGWRDALRTPLASYPWTQRWEENTWYLAFPGAAPAESLFDQFHWTPTLAYYSRPENIRFETNHLDPARDVTFTIAWQGRSLNGSYWTFAQVRNGSGVYSTVGPDSIFWTGKDNQLATATLPGTAVSEGLTNAVVTWGRRANSPPDVNLNRFAPVGLNWFQATYWRGFRAIANRLSCNSGDVADTFEVVATGFSDSTTLRAYDVTDPADPRRLEGVRREPDGAQFALRFQDEALPGAPRRYLVFSEAKSVDPSRITAVTRRGLAAGPRGDYLLVVPEAWLGEALDSLVALRQRQGLAVTVSPLEAVFDEFNGGRRSAWAIKRYLRFALNQWGAKFVLLVGDGSEDPLNRIGDSGPDIIPVHKVPGPVGVTDGREMVPSDGWYAWCLNGCAEGEPIVPELFIGRLPARTFQEFRDVVAKLRLYEAFAPDQTWRKQLLLLSDDQYSGSGLSALGVSGYCLRSYEDRFRLLNEAIRDMILGTAGLRRSEIEHFDLGVWLAGEPVDGSIPPCRPDLGATQNRTRAEGGPSKSLLARLNAGRMWWNYQGHANEFVLAHENVYRNYPFDDDKDLLVNDDKPFLFSAFSCHANAFARASEQRSDLGPSIGEDLVLRPRRGGIASFASVGYEIIPDPGINHINVAWARSMFVDPPHDDLLGDGDRGARVVLGETIAQAFLRYVPGVGNDPSESGVALTYTLLGDPATRLSIGAPQAIVTANGDTVVSDRPVALAPPRDILNLEADLVSNVEIRRIELIEGGSGGSRVLPDTSYTLSPAFPDTAPGGLGGRRYHLSYTQPLRAGVTRYTLRTVDRYGQQDDFNVILPFQTTLFVSGNRLIENDRVAPSAVLTLAVTLPTPITDPQASLGLVVDTLAQNFTAIPTDTTGRAWILGWDHAPYPPGPHRVELTALDSLTSEHRFRVVDGTAADGGMLRDVMAFPNPFDDQLGSTFSYYLIADGPADVMLRMFTVTGRLVYQRVERALAPGYHQWPWDGRDAEGDRLANGVYLYRLVASSGTRTETFDGRLVKLRKPRRGSTSTP